RSGANDHRVTVKHLTGVSDRRRPDFVAQCAEIKSNGRQKMLVSDATGRSAVLDNIEPFPRIVAAQGLEPMVIGFGLIPVGASQNGTPFGDYFCTRGAAYASTKQVAQALLEVYSKGMWYLVHSVYSPILSHPNLYDGVV